MMGLTSPWTSGQAQDSGRRGKTVARSRHMAPNSAPSPGRSPLPSDGRGVRGEGNGERGGVWPVLRSSPATEDGGEGGPTPLARFGSGAAGNQASIAYFLAVLFPHNQTQILPYNRVLKDLNALTP